MRTGLPGVSDTCQAQQPERARPYLSGTAKKSEPAFAFFPAPIGHTKNSMLDSRFIPIATRTYKVSTSPPEVRLNQKTSTKHRNTHDQGGGCAMLRRVQRSSGIGVRWCEYWPCNPECISNASTLGFNTSTRYTPTSASSSELSCGYTTQY